MARRKKHPVTKAIAGYRKQQLSPTEEKVLQSWEEDLDKAPQDRIDQWLILSDARLQDIADRTRSGESIVGWYISVDPTGTRWCVYLVDLTKMPSVDVAADPFRSILFGMFFAEFEKVVIKSFTFDEGFEGGAFDLAVEMGYTHFVQIMPHYLQGRGPDLRQSMRWHRHVETLASMFEPPPPLSPEETHQLLKEMRRISRKRKREERERKLRLMLSEKRDPDPLFLQRAKAARQISLMKQREKDLSSL